MGGGEESQAIRYPEVKLYQSHFTLIKVDDIWNELEGGA